MTDDDSILAYAGPCGLWEGRVVLGSTVLGGKIMYENDYTLRRILSVTFHELFHALGVFYDFLDNMYVDPSDGSSQAPNYFKVENDIRYFGGPLTMAYFNEQVGCTDTPIEWLPLENQGGDGTANYHWEQSLVVNEFFAGIEIGEGGYMSKLSFKALEDSGHWLVDYTNIPDFKSPQAGAGCDALSQICNTTDYPEFYCANYNDPDICHWTNEGMASCQYGYFTFPDNCYLRAIILEANTCTVPGVSGGSDYT